MKFYRSFRIREQGFPSELYSEICAKKPESRGKGDFDVESQPGDVANSALIERLVDFCEQHSVPQAKISGEFKAYNYAVVRHYEADDLKTTPFLILETQKRMFRDGLERDAQGRLMLPAKNATATIKIASCMFKALYVASDAAKTILEAGQLTGLIFRETVLKGTSASATNEPFWEIDSNLKMPVMVNAVLNPHPKMPCYMIDERPYRYGEPHYRQQDLGPLGNFDIARTFEQLGASHGLIVSQHFYQYCLKNKIELVARPVRIDPV